MGENASIAELLRGAEASGHEYGVSRVDLRSAGRDVLVVSDLHLGAGRGPDGAYPGTENFFADAAFARFLDHAASRAGARGAILVVNGDFLDFLRVVAVPGTDDELRRWQDTLAAVGITRTVDALRASISPKETEFGLKTDDYKSVWKLECIIAGHSEAFGAIAAWVAKGNQIALVKGNHDLDLYWRPVRDLLRLRLAEHIGRNRETPASEALRDVVTRVVFADDSLLIDGDVAIVHGHRFDRFSHVVGGPLLAGGTELNLPFGSFFNRYLLNRLEDAYPFLDNVRPRENVLALLIRERFPLALRVLFAHIPFLVHVIPKRYYRYVFRRFLTTALAIVIPVGLVLWLEWGTVSRWIDAVWTPASTAGGVILSHVMDLVQNLAGLVIAYFLARIVAWFQLEEATSLVREGLALLHAQPEYRIVVFGHTHNPDQVEERGRWVYNTGTWVPIVETTIGELREDRCYTFLRLSAGGDGRLQPGALERWDDAAARPERLVVVHRR